SSRSSSGPGPGLASQPWRVMAPLLSTTSRPAPRGTPASTAAATVKKIFGSSVNTSKTMTSIL
ncbi:WDYHV1 isoform 7, partial [Pongo abelii]